MSNRTLKIIIAIFVVLGLAAFFPSIEKKIRGEKKNDAKNVSVSLASFTKDSVEKIVFKQGDKEKTIALNESKWFIGDIEADETNINALFDDFQEMEIGTMVSKNSENHSKFSLTQEEAIKMIITQNGKDTTFLIGKAGQQPMSFYIRKEGLQNVYLATGNLRDKATWEADKWEKKAEGEIKEEPSGNPLKMN